MRRLAVAALCAVDGFTGCGAGQMEHALRRAVPPIGLYEVTGRVCEGQDGEMVAQVCGAARYVEISAGSDYDLPNAARVVVFWRASGVVAPESAWELRELDGR